MESAADFGTGLRAHLGLEQRKFELSAARAAAPEPPAVDEIDEAEADEIADAAPDRAALDALEALETELLERERSLAEREASLASRAGALLATAQALYNEVLGGGASPTSDEYARLRRRRSVA